MCITPTRTGTYGVETYRTPISCMNYNTFGIESQPSSLLQHGKDWLSFLTYNLQLNLFRFGDTGLMPTTSYAMILAIQESDQAVNTNLIHIRLTRAH